MQHPDEGTIHAWLDGALTVEEAAGVESHAAECSECSAAIAEARGLVAASSRILVALDDVPHGVLPAPQARPRPWYVRNDFRAAAAILLVAGASLVVVRNEVNELPRGDIAAVSEAGVAADAPFAASAGPARADDSRVATTDAGQEKRGEATARDSEVFRGRAQLPKRASASSGIAEGASSVAKANPLQQGKVAVSDEANFSGGRAKSAAVSAMIASPPETPTQRDQTSVQREERALGERIQGTPLEGTRSATMESTAPALAERSAARQRVIPPTARAAAMEPNADRTPLRIVRVDSATAVRRTVYEVAIGVEVILAETGPVDRKTALSDKQGRRSDARAQAMAAAPARPPSTAPTPADASVTSQRADAGAAGTSGAGINSISWMDPRTGRQYTLSGAVSREQLEVLRARIESRKP